MTMTQIRDWTPYFATVSTGDVQTVTTAQGKNFRWLSVLNADFRDYFIQLFDVSGDITVGVTVPTLSLLIPKGNGLNYGALDMNLNIRFTNAIRYAIGLTPTGDSSPVIPVIVNGAYE